MKSSNQVSIRVALVLLEIVQNYFNKSLTGKNNLFDGFLKKYHKIILPHNVTFTSVTWRGKPVMWGHGLQEQLLPCACAVPCSGCKSSLAFHSNINMGAWEKLERVSTFYTAPRQVFGTVLVLCHLGTASGTENTMRQNLWLTQIALTSGTPAFILCCQKSSIRAIQNAKQTMEKQAHEQSVGKK